MSVELDALWKRYGSLALDDIPAEAQLASGRCIMDWFGCTLAGSREPLSEILRAEFADEMTGPATILGTNHRASTKVAALVNGSAGHALDFDDTNLIGGLHATASVLPAAFAVAESIGASGADLLVAYTVGVELCSRLRVAMGEAHYRSGWHITSTNGIFGAAAAVGWLLGLDQEQFRCAMGLAASQASGIHANFGTMTKPFHAGHAAERGLLAASLAKRGYTANGDAFDAYMMQTSGAAEWDKVEALADTWVVVETLFKKYSSCAGTQATIEATMRLLEGGLTVDDIVHAKVRVHPTVTKICTVLDPVTGLQAKFSLPGVLALTMLGENLSNPETFTTPVVDRPQVAEIVHRVEVVGDPAIGQGNTTVDVETRTGVRQGEFRFTKLTNHPPDLGEQLAAKFMTLTPAIVGSKAEDLKDRLLDLPGTPAVSSIVALCLPD